MIGETSATTNITGGMSGGMIGGTSGTTYGWNTAAGVKASTTHNVYGIYDMSGGKGEYVSAIMDGGSAIDFESLVASYAENGTKYVDFYRSGDGSQAGIYETMIDITGDAVYETSSSYTGNNSWDGVTSITPYSDNVLFVRGGSYNSPSGTGIFAFAGYSGAADSILGFRAVLSVPGPSVYNLEINNGNASSDGEVDVGETITITASPNTGYRFVNWTATGITLTS